MLKKRVPNKNELCANFASSRTERTVITYQLMEIKVVHLQSMYKPCSFHCVNNWNAAGHNLKILQRKKVDIFCDDVEINNPRSI